MITIVQFYPEDNDMAKVILALTGVLLTGARFDTDFCECGHMNWVLTEEMGKITAAEVKEHIDKAGLVYETVLVSEAEYYDQ